MIRVYHMSYKLFQLLIFLVALHSNTFLHSNSCMAGCWFHSIWTLKSKPPTSMTRWEKPSGFHLAVYLNYDWWKKILHHLGCINSISQLHIWYQNHNRQIPSNSFHLKVYLNISLWFLGIPMIFSSHKKNTSSPSSTSLPSNHRRFHCWDIAPYPGTE